ncbi:hypothetical protein HK098_007027 [Nowakowskiella sp. JEL0407]|nr:hypothetical protein HK098_007027 [Nowakowskiella sp. JEL0407]
MGSIYRKFVSAAKELGSSLSLKKKKSENFDEEHPNRSGFFRMMSPFKTHSTTSSETASYYDNDINTELSADKYNDPIENYYYQPELTYDASDTYNETIPTVKSHTVSPSFPGSLSSISTAYVPQNFPSPPSDFCHPSIPSMSSSYDSQYVGSKISHHSGSSFSSAPCFVPSYRSSISPKSSMDRPGSREIDMKFKRGSKECNIPSKFFGSDNSQTPSYALAMAVARMQESQNTMTDNDSQMDIDPDGTMNYEETSRQLQRRSSLIEKSREDWQKDAKKTKKVTSPIGKSGVQKKGMPESLTAKRKKNRLHEGIRKISEDHRISVDSLCTEVRRF